MLFDIKQPYDRKITDGILDAMHNSNRNLQITFMTYDEALLVAHDQDWDAIIADFDRLPNIDLCASLKAPTVAVFSNLQRMPELTDIPVIFLAPDSEKICQLARDHLLACGCRQFAYFAGTADDIGLWARERRLCFKQAVLEEGLNWAGAYTTQSIRHFLQTDLAPGTGFLCASDTQARQLITLAQNLNISIPSQLCVIGIDNDEVENQLSRIPISTVTLAPSDLGKAAFEALFELSTQHQPVTKLIQPGEVMNRLSAFLEVNDDPLLSTALKFIYKHYHRSIKAEQVIAECKTSRNTLESRFKTVLEKSIHQVLHDVRLENAKDMLKNTRKGIDEVAIQCGFSSPQYLYYIFRKELGMTPTKYRELNTPEH
ncbi:PurR protein [Reinekea sp. MED297]|uniref:PurR protein n=1 Tax=Reinekea blandensis MED297 TaxID=314283 RepID=A4BCC5_9GAMM|nr:PurR protein [Reinekea sp. MED297] [Reinekea blandensis MED297]